MKIALTYVDRGLDTSARTTRQIPAPPIGIGYLDPSLRACGHETKMYLQGNRTIEQLAKDIALFSPDILGLSCLTYNLPDSQKLASIVKQHRPQTTVVYGGEHPSLSPETTLTEGSIVVIGEADLTFPDLTAAIAANQDLRNVPGIAFLELKWKTILREARDNQSEAAAARIYDYVW